MRKHLLIYFFLSVFLALLIYCSDAGIEITNGTGNCTGTIYNADSTFAANAVVRLIPLDYNPFNPSGHLDSTTTDGNGHYVFNVAQANVFSIIAQKGNTSCLIDSVKLQPEKNQIENGVLQASGIIKGIATVMSGDSPLDIVILVRGTTVYTSPFDSIGHYLTPLLPSGTFTIQFIFTGMSEYEIIDTVVEILQGDTTMLDVTLSSKNAPKVNSLSVSFDNKTMFATLDWPTVDTSKIVNYMITRKSTSGNDTDILIDKSSISYTDDLLKLELDTITYGIKAIGKSFKEGYSTLSQLIIPMSNYHITKEITLQEGVFVPWMYVDTFENSILSTDNGIKKFDNNGSLIKTYQVKNDFETYNGGCSIQSDESGNVYLFNSSIIDSNSSNTPAKIDKLDNQLNLIRSIDVSNMNAYKLVVSKGEIFLFCPKISTSMELSQPPLDFYIAKYDTNLNLIGHFNVVFNHKVWSVIPFSNGFGIPDYLPERILMQYDDKFKVESKINILEYFKLYIPNSLIAGVANLTRSATNRSSEEFVIMGNQELYEVHQNGGYRTTLMLVGNCDKQLITRRLLVPSIDHSECICFDLNNNLYQFSKKFGEKSKIYKYQLVK
jgi:hypothetical protein